MTRTIAFPGCWLHVNVEELFLQTVFSDGAQLCSVPVKYKDPFTAQRYGYGDDWLRLWREHDMLHHWIAVQFGHEYSPTIWSECHPNHPAALPAWARQGEEEFIAHVHRWLNGGAFVSQLWPLAHGAQSVEALYLQAQSFLACDAEFIEVAPAREPIRLPARRLEYS